MHSEISLYAFLVSHQHTYAFFMVSLCFNIIIRVVWIHKMIRASTENIWPRWIHIPFQHSRNSGSFLSFRKIELVKRGRGASTELYVLLILFSMSYDASATKKKNQKSNEKSFHSNNYSYTTFATTTTATVFFSFLHVLHDHTVNIL